MPRSPRDSRQIPARLAHGRLPFRWVDDNDHLGTLMPFGAPSTLSLTDNVTDSSKRPFRPFPMVQESRSRAKEGNFARNRIGSA